MRICRRLTAVLAGLILIAYGCHADDMRRDQPLRWLSGDRSAMATAVRRSLYLPGISQPVWALSSEGLSAPYLDMTFSFGIRNDSGFRARAFEVLDSAVSAERRLDEAWKSADQTNDSYRAAYYFVTYRLKFAQALAKVEVSRRMADAGSSSYCTQAMESAIDGLKASAEAREQFERLRDAQGYGRVTDLPSVTIRLVRESLLSAWHSSKSQGSLQPIGEIDVRRIVNDSATRTVKDVRARKELTSLFAWLQTAPAGNHPATARVE